MVSAARREATPSPLGIGPASGHVDRVKRPKHLDPPRTLSKSPPLPEPGQGQAAPPDGEESKLDPTRYGDWEKKGIAVDF
ncbi:MAG: DUF1674 domain-containing protein [Sphingomonas sp.]|jgi:hypothetical protein|nr:DUF1674 domain-containing protein [Sphingomonas sp.]MBA3835974.1 DUF1674 domain-containing protein [Sphingomonas sp.]